MASPRSLCFIITSKYTINYFWPTWPPVAVATTRHDEESERVNFVSQSLFRIQLTFNIASDVIKQDNVIKHTLG